MSKNKKIIIISLTLILILVIVTVFSVRSNTTPTPSSSVPLIRQETSTGTKYQTFFPLQTDTSNLSDKVNNNISQSEIDKMDTFLPTYIEKFATSVGIDTTINLFQLKSEPKHVIHLEIYNINYVLSEIKTENPNPTAFKESFLYIKNLLLENNINLNNIQIIYGNRDYIQTTSEYWIKTFNLLP